MAEIGIALLVAALLLWLALIAGVLGHFEAPATGASLMVTVSTESIAVLSAMIATAERAPWLVTASLATLLLGLALYGLAITRFDFSQLTHACGDQWVTGGALAISALAAARIALAARNLHTLAAIVGPLKTAAFVLWILALLWLVPLLYSEAAHPRPRYHLERWSTVFPLGMYAVCSFALGPLLHTQVPATFAKAGVWIAVAVWAAVCAGVLRRGVSFLGRRSPAGEPGRSDRMPAAPER